MKLTFRIHYYTQWGQQIALTGSLKEMGENVLDKVLLMDYQEDRQVLSMWAEKRGPQGIEDYWAEKNQVSLDGKPTGILD